MKSTWPGRVDQVELVVDAVRGGVAHPDGVQLDRDAALALQVHGVEDLLAHLALVERAGGLDEPVRQSGLAVVDVGDDAEIADVETATWGEDKGSGAAGRGDGEGRIQDL